MPSPIRHYGNAFQAPVFPAFFGMALIALLATLPAIAAAQPSVVSAYEEIRGSGLAPDLTYEIRSQGGGWVTTSPDWGTAMPVTVDAANGYVKIWDEGTGGGAYETQVVLWRQADGLPLVGIAETGYDPVPGNTRLRFFAHDRHSWDEITGYSWPGVGLADFMTPEMSVADLRALEAINARVYIELPRSGLSPVARLAMPEEEIRAVCAGEDWIVVRDTAPYLRYCERLAAPLYRVIRFDFDRVAVRFRMAAKGR
jgi:hypothetical protein